MAASKQDQDVSHALTDVNSLHGERVARGQQGISIFALPGHGGERLAEGVHGQNPLRHGVRLEIHGGDHGEMGGS